MKIFPIHTCLPSRLWSMVAATYEEIAKNISSTLPCLFLLLFASCAPDEPISYSGDGSVVSRPPIWTMPLPDAGDISEAAVATPIVYNNENILVGGNANGQRSIMSINAYSGRLNWEWSDLLTLFEDPGYKDPIHIQKKTYHQNNNKFFFTYAGSSYCINLNDGQTLWKYKVVRSRNSNNAGIDDIYFTSGATYGPVGGEKIYYGDLNSPSEDQLLITPHYTSILNPHVSAQGVLTSMKTFNRAGNSYLAFGIENPSVDIWVASWGPRDWGATELNLYNITQGKYEYEKVVINPDRDTRVITDIIFKGDSLYFRSSNYIHCYEAMTGKELWRQYRGPSMLDSPMILANGKLFTVHDYGFLYCSDARTGDFLWSVQDTDTPLELSYLNGVLYYVGAREGILHAVDANSGNHLWRISPPDRNLATPLRGTCSVVAGRNSEPGVVVITTRLNVFAYQAIQ